MTRPSNSIIDRCGIPQLKALLTLAVGPDREGASALALPTDPRILTHLLTELSGGEAGSGELLLESVCRAETPLKTLRGIKDLAKEFLARATTEAHRNAAILLYHTAVAAAFGRHGTAISTRSIDGRLPLYEDLATILAGQPLGNAFRQAVGRALDKDGTSEQSDR